MNQAQGASVMQLPCPKQQFVKVLSGSENVVANA